MNMIEKIRANAELAVQQMGPLSNLGAGFGFNRESIVWVEGYIERLRNSGEFSDTQKIGNLSSVLGSFLGECIVQTYGGEWRNPNDRWGIYFSNQSAAFPFAKVTKQFENGLEGGDSILGFFDLIPRVLLNRDDD